VRGIAALKDAEQLELDRLGQVVEQVEEPLSRTEVHEPLLRVDEFANRVDVSGVAGRSR
jgi:hypothetical protein